MRKKNKQKDLVRSEHLANRSSQVFIPSLSPEEQRTFPGPFGMAEQQRVWVLRERKQKPACSPFTASWAGRFGRWKPRAAMEINLLKTK